MERLIPPISWKTFSESFLVKFFPMTSKVEMEGQFINLSQGRCTVDYYAADLPDSVIYMVAQEGDRARRFFQGLDINIQSHIAILPLNTYAQVPETARTQEQILQERR